MHRLYRRSVNLNVEHNPQIQYYPHHADCQARIKMGYSQAQKAESRQRVLDTAARQIREHGLEALGVADCMRSAGLTHGAFYGHFSSRDALIIAALEQAMTRGQKRVMSRAADAEKHSKTPLEAIADAYLHPAHADNPGTGCALCALAGDAVHATADVKALYTTHLRRLADQLTQAAGGENESGDESGSEALGLGVAATIVGAITLARAVDDHELALSILTAAHALVMKQDGTAQQ
jgi:TetR/AcrR family transcriptional regulator, transcriptional repressor for nem operon